MSTNSVSPPIQPKAWEPSIPPAQVAPHCLERARQLQAALAQSLARRNDASLTEAERVKYGLEEYQREIGHAISESQWRRLFIRTLDRDSGLEDWNRLELYLPESPALNPIYKAIFCDGVEGAFRELHDCLSGFNDLATPTAGEKAALWSRAFECLEYEIDQGTPAVLCKGRLIDFLWKHARFLAPNTQSKDGLRRNFDRQYRRWQENGGHCSALLDKRRLKRGAARAKPFNQGDLDLIVGHAARNCVGRVRQAARELGELGDKSGLSRDMQEVLCRSGANKSYIPHRLADAVKHEVRLVRPYFLGHRHVLEATASLERNYTNLHTLQVVCGDDFTWPVYFFVPDGEDWFKLMRGQCLLFIDVRSLKVIAWTLIPHEVYNSLAIRSLMNEICLNLGVPSVWYFENGIWRKSKLVKGETPAEWQDGLSWEEIYTEWDRLGVRFIHAKPQNARAKPVELVGGLLQNRMEGIKGYCGRNERFDCPERTSQAKRDIAARRVEDPSELLYSFEDWQKVLGSIIADYNASEQDGEILQGMSPAAAFDAYWPHDDPPKRFDANCWHLCAHYVCQRLVREDGISFKIGKTRFTYRDENTSRDRGTKPILAWFDPAHPEFLGVTDLSKRNPYIVARANKVDFLASLDSEGPAGEAYREELAKVAAHNAYPKERYHMIKPIAENIVRSNIVDRKTAALAKGFKEGRAEKQADQREEETREARIRRKAKALGQPLTTLADFSRRTEEGLDLALAAERDLKRESATTGKENNE